MQFAMREKDKVENFIDTKKRAKRKSRIILSEGTQREIEELSKLLQNETKNVKTR